MLGCRGSCRVTVPLQCFVRGLFTLFLPQKSVHRAKLSVPGADRPMDCVVLKAARHMHH